MYVEGTRVDTEFTFQRGVMVRLVDAKGVRSTFWTNSNVTETDGASKLRTYCSIQRIFVLKNKKHCRPTVVDVLLWGMAFLIGISVHFFLFSRFWVAYEYY